MSQRVVRQVQPFRLQARPSRLWLGFVLLMHALYGAAILACMPQQWWLLLPAPLSLAYCLAVDGWLWPRPGLSSLEVGAHGELTILYRGLPLSAQLLPSSTVWSWLTVLQLQSGGRRFSLMLLPDSTSLEARRRLNMYVRWFPPADTEHHSELP